MNEQLKLRNCVNSSRQYQSQAWRVRVRGIENDFTYSAPNSPTFRGVVSLHKQTQRFNKYAAYRV